MSINNARTFVAKLREDHKFRNKVLETTKLEDFFVFLKEESLTFNQREIVGAIIECMEQLELQKSS